MSSTLPMASNTGPGSIESTASDVQFQDSPVMRSNASGTGVDPFDRTPTSPSSNNSSHDDSSRGECSLVEKGPRKTVYLNCCQCISCHPLHSFFSPSLSSLTCLTSSCLLRSFFPSFLTFPRFLHKFFSFLFSPCSFLSEKKGVAFPFIGR